MKTLLATIENRVDIPALHTIKAKGGTLISTDMDIETQFKVNLSDIKTGLYNFKPLKEGIYSLSDIDLADFPTFAPFGDTLHTVKAVKLADIEFVNIAVSKEETRYYLNGIAFDTENMVATDGHRLHLIPLATDSLKDKPALMIPRKAIKLFIMACKESKVSSFDIEFSEHKARAVIGNYTIITKLIDGTYPDYKRVIPSSHEYELEFKADSILKNYKKLKAIANGRSCAVKLSGDKVTAKSELGEYECESGLVMPLNKEIGFNLNYLKESAMDGILHFQDSVSPVMLKSGNRLAVLIPLRI
jgi:DNA polymerase-3 subunit beta